jgi:hypothetical protein
MTCRGNTYTSSIVVNLKKVFVEPRHRLERNTRIKMDLKICKL